MKTIALTLAILSAGLSAEAAVYESGNDIFRGCGVSDARFEDSFSFGFIIGANDQEEMLGKYVGLPGFRLACVPENVTAGQMRDVICKYLESHPETRNKAAGFLVHEAKVSAWPCQ